MPTTLTTTLPARAMPAGPDAETSSSAVWLTRHRADPAPARHTLVTFPWSGAGTSAYSSWLPVLPDDIDLITVTLHGRDARRDEAALTKLSSPTVDAIADEILTTTDGSPNVALFGHSYGALLAHAVALRLQQHDRTPQAVIVSGSRAPMIRPPHSLHLLGDRELLARLTMLGGLPARLRRHKQFLSTWLPRVRADLTASETYWPGKPAVLDCALTAWSGAQDWYAPPATARRWLACASEATHTTFPGSHFFISGDIGATRLLTTLQWPRPAVTAVRPLRLLQTQPLLKRGWGS
ncbi:thioesterase II family protein [Lentzea flaviverrucosa]|uniref:Pyochelin biosynthetic protein PchC n=1 Tax=Lentzea flaviverrucosa TaxID=200379 RepID=A0A1H9ETM2_9PSEU|nr:thioesterase domain-containing protein [Lentzea flaviverrucosa]RDI35408.1 surfactin synthase thioesterase subunit [Lentzea flaviverrucosa]SEQ28583.1 pyochelin biosynthetic protein PchC [Lentzea flaviverrucosa]